MEVIVISSENLQAPEKKRFEGKYETASDLIRISYLDSDRKCECSLIFSKTRAGFFRVRENGDVSVSGGCNMGQGSIEIELQGRKLMFGITRFVRKLLSNGVELSYTISYSDSESSDIKIKIFVPEYKSE